MKKLSVGQLKAASGVFGNLAVAWLTVGVIAPLFARPETLLEFFLGLAVSLIMFSFCFYVSLRFVKRVKS